MPKGKSPFRVLQGEGDTLKKEIDAFMEECGLVLDDSSLKDRTSRMKKLFERCGALRKKCKALEKKLTNLSKGKEPTVIPNFDEMRSEEVERMHVLEVRLKKIGNKLEPDEVEESYFNNVKDNDESMKEQGSKPPTGEIDDDSNDDDDDDDDDDEEDEEIDDEEKEESKMEITNPDEENDGDVDKEDDGKKTKFKRLNVFRRSKTDIKVEKVEDEAEKEKKDKKDKDKKDKKDKDKKGKEKSEKEKEKEKEKERKEQEKKEKKEKEKLEKERKEKEKKEQKEKEQEEKRKKKEEKEVAAKLAKSKKGEDGDTKKDKDEDKRPDSPSKRRFGAKLAKSKKGEEGDTKKDKDEDKRPDSPSKRGFGAKLFNRDSKKPKIEESKKEQSGTIEDESEDEEDAEDGIDSEGAEEDMEEEDEGREEEEEEEDEEEELEDVEEEEEEEEEEMEEEQEKQKQKKVEPKQDKKKGWSFLRRDKSPQRQVKKDNEKDDKKKKKEDKKQVRVQEEEEEEDEGEEEEEDEEEEEYEEEEEEEEEEESDDDQVVMKGKKPQRVESEEEEEEDSEEDEEEEEGEEEELEDEEEESEEELFEGESDEEEEEENFKPPDEGMDLFEAVCDFDGEEDDDLYFKRGAILTILNVREDGWWMAEDEEGNKGLVPSTYLKLKKEHNDYRDVQSPEVDEPAETVSPRSGKELWRGLRKSVTETGVTDVLTAMGAIPAGFRPSTTAKHLRLDAYTLCNFLKPRFTESRLGFQDLNWSPHENQIRAKTVRLQKILTLLMVRNMPACGVGIEIRSRHVRICFFDGDKILSNIHTIQATWNKNDPKTWKFSPKVTSLLPSILDGDCFIRSSRTEENTGLLFELCLSYVRPKTGEKGELSCGWVNVPLYDTATGAPIVNKMYELQVQGGTPFEQDVEVDPSISRRKAEASSSKFRSMMSANKQPRIQIKFITPTKEQKTLLDMLPETIVSSLGYLPFLSIFRNLQAVEVLRDRIDLQNADLIHCPVLANFPEATKYPDIMDALRSCWADKKLKNKKIDKKDPEQMKELFTSTFMDSVYPIMRLPSLTPYRWADEDRDSERWQVISEFLQSNKQKGILASFLAPGGEHSPFDMTEVAFNLLDSFQELK